MNDTSFYAVLIGSYNPNFCLENVLVNLAKCAEKSSLIIRKWNMISNS